MGVAPTELREFDTVAEFEADRSWSCTVWDDPVNLMAYVTYVFMTYFHYQLPKAQKLMWTIHSQGRAAVSTGAREEMERDVVAMHSYGLWATVTRDE